MSSLMEFWSLLTLFGNVNHEGGEYRVSHGSPLICPVEHAYTGFTYVKLKDTRQSLGTNGVNEYNILKFSAYYETAKFTGIQSDLLSK